METKKLPKQCYTGSEMCALTAPLGGTRLNPRSPNMSTHPRPWHRGSIFGDGHRVPMDRERRAVWKARVEIHRKAGRITDGHSYVALALMKRLGTDGRCDPSHETLSGDSGESVDTVKKALKALYGLGMVDWLRRLIREGTRVWQTSNSYLLALRNPAVLPAVRCEVDSARGTTKAPSGNNRLD